MKNKINIAEILKNKPKGTRLYSPIFGECAFSLVREETDDICVKKHNGEIAFFDSKGLYNTLGEVMLFPSKSMQNWSKFAWKKGDVLVSIDGGTEVIFDKWYDETYTSFYCKHYLNSEDENKILYYEAFLCTTERYSLEDKDSVQTYINTIEERLGGKLNRGTLEVEKSQPEFKEGDIVSLEIRYINSEDVTVETYIVYGDYNYGDELNFYAGCNNLCMIKHNSCVKPTNTSVRKVFIRYATDSEKKQLFDTLAKEGKAWDSEKKVIVDLKPKWTPKPFDRVITRNAADDVWTANIFSHIDSHGEYVTIACVGGYTYCLPYNEETAKLIGTTNNWEG